MLQRKWIVNNEGRLLAAWTDSSAATQAQATVERRVGARSRRARRSARISISSPTREAMRSVVGA